MGKGWNFGTLKVRHRTATLTVLRSDCSNAAVGYVQDEGRNVTVVFGVRVLWVGGDELADTCKCGKEPSGSVKCGEFVDWLRNC